jgi:hypothetical protein
MGIVNQIDMRVKGGDLPQRHRVGPNENDRAGRKNLTQSAQR